MIRKGGGFLWLGIILAAAVGQIGTDAQKDIPEPKLSKLMGPTIKFLYCYSWGYQKVFQQYAGILQQKYPDIYISGDNFPPGGFRLQAAQIISIIKFIVILMVLSSFNPFPFLGQDTPSWATWMLENKIYACMMTFFLCNAVETQLISTGAFEIHLNDMPVWSKLEAGRIPQPGELFQIIENHMNMKIGGSGGQERIGDYHDEL